jgi:hypothetical protein
MSEERPPPAASPKLPDDSAPLNLEKTPAYGVATVDLLKRKLMEAEVRIALVAEQSAEKAASKAAAKESNGKPRIPASWAPFLLLGSAVSAGLITVHELMPNDVPRICMVIGSFGLAVFGPLLAASPGLRKGAPK